MSTNPVFVFGSNKLGIHGAGAARVAKDRYGARYGVGVGRTGDAYAIPTKARPSRGNADTLSLTEIGLYVADFIAYATNHPKTTFLVTRIGCGLAGYADRDVAPLFATVPENVHLPLAWHTIVFGAPKPDRVSFTE